MKTESVASEIQPGSERRYVVKSSAGLYLMGVSAGFSDDQRQAWRLSKGIATLRAEEFGPDWRVVRLVPKRRTS